MKINKASKDTVSVKSLIKNNFHYAHLLSLSGNDSDISEIITILTDLGFSEKRRGIFLERSMNNLKSELYIR